MGQNSAGCSDLGAADFRIIEKENKLGHHLHPVGNCNILTCISVKEAQGLLKVSTENDQICWVSAKRMLRLHWYFALILLASNMVFIPFQTLSDKLTMCQWWRSEDYFVCSTHLLCPLPQKLLHSNRSKENIIAFSSGEFVVKNAIPVKLSKRTPDSSAQSFLLPQNRNLALLSPSAMLCLFRYV